MAPRVDNHRRQVASFGGPCDEARSAQRVDAELSRGGRFGLPGIASDDFQVRRWAERDERVARAFARVLTARRRANAQQCLDTLYSEREIGRRIDEMIDPAKKTLRVRRLRGGLCPADEWHRDHRGKQTVLPHMPRRWRT